MNDSNQSPREQFFGIIEDGLDPESDTEIIAMGGSMFDGDPLDDLDE